MTDFLLELRSEEIPARMQTRAREDLQRLFAAELAKAGLAASALTTYATPRRLALIAHGLADQTAAIAEETKGPKTSAPPQALDGFLRKTGLTRDQLVERDGVFFAISEKPGRATTLVLAEAIPAIVRAFPWPKSMRWGDASIATDSLRWVRPLHGIVALFGEDIVPVEIAGIASGAATYGHRFHHPGPITIGSAGDYVEKLRLCHVIVDQAERETLIRTRAAALAAEAGLELVEDEGLVAENAGLTEWPVPLLGRFDETFLAVPPEVIQLTARVNQKYFVLKNPPRDGEGDRPAQPGGGGGSELGTTLANAFICTANIDASDGGAKIVDGNRKVLAARLADARFFYEQDLRIPLAEQAKKLDRIVFHEKLGTVADKVDRVAKLARWLVEEGIIKSSPGRGGEPRPQGVVEGAPNSVVPSDTAPSTTPPSGAAVPLPASGEDLSALAERAARLCKADLVTGMVGEFPELQGVMGGYYALAQGEDPQVAAAIRDHYKPVGQGDDVPSDPVTVAVSLADKLDSIAGFFGAGMEPTGSKDPFALRRSALSVIALVTANRLRLNLVRALAAAGSSYAEPHVHTLMALAPLPFSDIQSRRHAGRAAGSVDDNRPVLHFDEATGQLSLDLLDELVAFTEERATTLYRVLHGFGFARGRAAFVTKLLDFFADRLKVQQREAGVRHDLIDSVFALGGEDDLVRLLARVRALQTFMATEDGANLLTGYRRAANILKKEGFPSPLRGEGAERSDGGRGAVHDALPSATAPLPAGEREQKTLSYTPETDEAALIAALDTAEPRAADAVAAEDFEGAMAALASLRAPIDAFFDTVTVNDADDLKRAARLALLARVRDAVHTVADFAKIEG